MKIISLAENQSFGCCKPVHGLSLYIETKKHKMLFDVGPDETILENAALLGIDLAQVDTVVISHGHYDHGGALELFLNVNHQAKVYLQKRAFEAHYSLHGEEKVPIGLNPAWMTHPQLVLLDGDAAIDEELQVFTVQHTEKCHSKMNNILLDDQGMDAFPHEQNLLITDEQNLLCCGCGHTGLINILEKSPLKPAVVVGGLHLHSPRTGENVTETFLDEMISELRIYSATQFYTCHCTGEVPYRYLSERMPNMHYLSCGEQIEA